MAIACRKIRCMCDKNSPISTVLHGFGFGLRYVVAILIITAWINVAFAAVQVSVNDHLSVGDNATLSCSHEGTLRQLTWSKTEPGATTPNSNFIVQYNVGFPVSYGTGVDHTHYEFDKASNEMKVLGVTLDDERRYWCQAQASGFPDSDDSALAIINVPAAANTTTITYSGKPYMNGETIEVDTGAQTFTCTTTGVKPAATFVWTPDTPETTTSVANGADSRLFDSSSEVSIQIMKPVSPGLKCATSNTNDGSSGVEITVSLELKKEQVNPTETSNGGLSPGATAGLVIGVVVAFGIMIAMGAGAYHYNKRQS